MNKPLILRLKNYPEQSSPNTESNPELDHTDSTPESQSNLSPKEIKEKLKHIQDSLILIISEACHSVSHKNESDKIIKYIKDFKNTILRLISIQKEIFKLIISKEIVHELHNIFVHCTNYAIIYICNLKKMVNDNQEVKFQNMPEFLKMTLLKYGSLILLIPSINLSITTNCTEFNILKSLMSKLICMLINFEKKINRCIITSKDPLDYYTNLWDGFRDFNFNNILPDIFQSLNSLESIVLSVDKMSEEEHKRHMIYLYKDKIGTNLCNRLTNIIYKFPEMLELVLGNPHSHFIQMELIVTMFIYCVTQLLQTKEEFNFIQIEKMISYLSDILIDIINSPNYKLENHFIQLNSFIEQTNKEICTEIKNNELKTNNELETIKTEVVTTKKTAAATASRIAAGMAAIAVKSISECVKEAISVAAELSLQHEYTLELTIDAITSAVNASKAAAKSSFKAVKNVNLKINKIKKVSAAAALYATTAAYNATNVVSITMKIIEVAIIHKNNDLIKKNNDLIQKSKKLSKIIVNDSIKTVLSSITYMKTQLLHINKVKKEAAIVAKNAAKSAKLAELKAYKIMVWAAANRIAIHSITGIINTVKDIIIQKSNQIKKQHNNENTCYKFICTKVKQLENKTTIQEYKIIVQEKELEKQSIQITTQTQQLEEQKQQSQLLNSQLYHQQNQIDYLFRCLNNQQQQQQNPPLYIPSHNKSFNHKQYSKSIR